VSDIDGTIFRNKKISRKDLESIIEFQKEHILILATGRSYYNFSRVSDLYSLPYKYCILNNGSLIVDKFDNIVKEKTFPAIIVTDIYNAISKGPIEFALSISFSLSGVYYSNVSMISLENILQDIPIEISGMSITLPLGTINDYIDLKKHLYKLKSINVETNGRYVDILPKGVSKSVAAQFISKKLSVENDSIAVIGDSYNDISMFKYFKNSYVIKESEENVKKYAKKEVGNIAACITDFIK